MSFSLSSKSFYEQFACLSEFFFLHLLVDIFVHVFSVDVIYSLFFHLVRINEHHELFLLLELQIEKKNGALKFIKRSRTNTYIPEVMTK